MPQTVSLSAKAEPFTPTGPPQQQPKVDVRAGWGQAANNSSSDGQTPSTSGQTPSTGGRAGWGQAAGGQQPPPQQPQTAPYSIPHPQFTAPYSSYPQPPPVQYQGHQGHFPPAPGFMAPPMGGRPSAHPNVRQEIMAPPMMGPPPGEFAPYPIPGGQPLGPPPPGVVVGGVAVPPVPVPPAKEEAPAPQVEKKKMAAYVPKNIQQLQTKKKKEPTKEKEAVPEPSAPTPAPTPAPVPAPTQAPAPALASQRFRGSYKPPSKREDAPVQEPEEQAPPPEPPVVNEPTPARVTIKQDDLNPDIDVVTFELEYADEPLGLVFLQPDPSAAVVLRRVTPDSPGAKLESFVGRNVVAVTAKAQTYTIQHQSDISDAIRGEKHIILQFRKGPARPEAPRVPQSVPIRNIQANMLDLKKRLMPKAGKLIQELDVICDIAVTGAPEQVAETTKSMVFRAWQESSASRTGAEKPEARAEREIYKKLFKALGWDDVPVAVPPSDLCVLVSAQLFLQRKDKDDECNAELKAALGITTSDEDYALVVKKREEEQRIREEKLAKEKEESQKRMAAAKERMRNKATAAAPEPAPSAGSVDVADSIRAALREPAPMRVEAAPFVEAPPAPVRTTPLYPLSREWKMWHNRPNSSFAPNSPTEDGHAAYAKGLNQIPADISELGEFWQVLSNVPKPNSLPLGDSLALFRRNKDGSFVRPLWEDEANKPGGEWRARLREDQGNAAWVRAACHLISGSMPNDGIVCGISVERRKGGDRLAIWVDNTEEDSVMQVGEALKAAIDDLRATDLQGKPQTIAFTFHAEDLQGRTAADRQRRYEIA